MMRRALTTAALVALAACGDSGTDGADSRLRGTWGTSVPNAPGCVQALTFEGAEYEYDVICPLTSGQHGIEVELGAFDARDGLIEFMPERASCPNVSPETQRMRYEFINGGDSLRLVEGSMLIVLDRIEQNEPTGGVVAATGCFADDGAFEERAPQGI